MSHRGVVVVQTRKWVRRKLTLVTRREDEDIPNSDEDSDAEASDAEVSQYWREETRRTLDVEEPEGYRSEEY